MITQPGDGTDASGYARTRVSDAGRERAIDLLKAAFAEARLTRGKHTPNASSAPTARGHTPNSPSQSSSAISAPLAQAQPVRARRRRTGSRSLRLAIASLAALNMLLTFVLVFVVVR